MIIVRTAEEDRYGVDLPEYFTDMGEFLILLCHMRSCGLDFSNLLIRCVKVE